MPKMPIDPGRVMLVAGAMPAEPVLKNRETGEVATERGTGRTMFQLHLTAYFPGDPKPEVWTVKVAGQPPEFTLGQQVTAVGLVGTFWENNGRSGVSFRAEAMEPATASKRSTSSTGADVPPPPARPKAA